MSEYDPRLVDNLSAQEKRELLAKLLRKKPAESTSEHPLSYGQRALWFIQQVSPENAAYNVSFAGYIRSDLDVPALRRAFEKIVNRHASLRATFPVRDGNPVQLVHERGELHFDQVDVSSWSSDELERHLIREAHAPFDLQRGPLLRVNLFTRSAQEQILLAVFHHIIFDAMSMAVLLDELRTFYPLERSGLSNRQPPLRLQYTDYIRWQAERLAGPEGERLWAYWQKQLAGELSPINLPLDRPRPPFQTFGGAAHVFKVGEEITRKLKALARAEKATLYVTLLAAFQVLLHRYSGQEDICVGTPMAARNKAELEGVVGYFINPVVLRGNVSGNPTFKEFVGQMRQTVLGAIDHQDYPFPLLVERLQLDRDPSRSPVFQVMFNMPKTTRLEEQGVSYFVMGGSGIRMDMGGFEIELFGVRQQTAMFDLLFLAVETEGSLSASFHYNTDLFDATTIARMIGHLQTLFESIVAHPEHRLSELPLSTEAERRQLLVEWNATETDYPADSCVHQLFEAQAERTPESVAVSFADEQLTYRQLNRRANRMARLLGEQGVGPEALVALLAHRGVNLLTALLGLFKAGAAYLPLDPHHPPNRLLQVLESSGTGLVLAARELMPTLTQAVSGIPVERRPRVICLEELLQQEASEDNLAGASNPNGLAYVIYTSGSTGMPKGAMIEHRGLLNHLYAKLADLRLSSADIVAQTASQCFDVSVWQFLAALLVGGRVHIFDDGTAFDPRQLIRGVERERVTVLEIVPSLLRVLLDEVTSRAPARPDLSALRWLILTGEALPPELCRRWLSHYPETLLLNAYGPTECSDDITHYVIGEVPAANVIYMPIGRPVANMRLYVLDKHLCPVPVGVAGEICAGGIGVGRGYLNDPLRTAEVFIPDTFGGEPGARLYKTGDAGRYRPDGNIEYLDRLDQQVKIRGLRVELGEIESVLLQHTDVRDVVVVARESARGDKHLAAYLVADQDRKLTVSTLRGFLKERLPEYMVPSTFMMLDALPLTPNGKVDRRALPSSNKTRPEEMDSFVAPRTTLEETLAAIWAEVLGVEQVGIHDNFFELGGHSLLAVQLISRAREAFRIELPLRSFFDALTVAELAQVIETASGQGAGDIPGKTVADLNDQLVLDPVIRPPSSPVEPALEPASIFLTGATGFLGAFLLNQLLQHTEADIYCLIRASSVEEGKKKIHKTLESYCPEALSQSHRIIPVRGDLSQPLLGLSTSEFDLLAGRLDVIYHSAAMVNFAYSYEALKAANVGGTHEVLRLASQVKVKPVHYVSTISVFPPVSTSDEQIIREQDELDHGQALYDGYSQSKWVAEKLVTMARGRGLPVCIYRPGRITGHSRTGASNPDDLLFRLIKDSVGLGHVPALDIEVDMIPVDYVSAAIVHLSQQKESLGKVFHLVNPSPLPWGRLVDWVQSFGYPFRQIPFDRWRAELSRHDGQASESALYSLLHLFTEIMPEAGKGDEVSSPLALPQFDCRNTLEGLTRSSISCPPVGTELLATYFSYFIRSGFLKPPTNGRGAGECC